MKSEICEAINNWNLIEFYYDGYPRVVEPHTFGVSSKGNDILSAYQVGGGSKQGKVEDWRLFTIDKISSLSVLKETFTDARNGYRKGDSRMVQIYCEL